MPITRGHVLVATRAHRPKLSDVTVAEAKALGVWVGVVSRAVLRALGDGEGGGGEGEGQAMGDWNVVQNNGMFFFGFLGGGSGCVGIGYTGDGVDERRG